MKYQLLSYQTTTSSEYQLTTMPYTNDFNAQTFLFTYSLYIPFTDLFPVLKGPSEDIGYEPITQCSVL